MPLLSLSPPPPFFSPSSHSLLFFLLSLLPSSLFSLSSLFPTFSSSLFSLSSLFPTFSSSLFSLSSLFPTFSSSLFFPTISLLFPLVLVKYHMAHLHYLQGQYLDAKETFESILSSKAVPHDIKGKTLRQLGKDFFT